tara:strand:+ start:10713 stop:10967 length:255 start_codon:yes stop_codon:yes gene_type:complete
MRHKRIRRTLLQTLRENPEGLTAIQIMDKLDKKKRAKVSNAKHIGVLLRGLKGVKKMREVDIHSDVYRYKVNVYYYDENEGAEI